MEATAAQGPKKTAPDWYLSRIRAVRLMREKLVGEFMKELKYVAAEAAKTAPANSPAAKDPHGTSLSLVTACYGTPGVTDLNRAEHILDYIQQALCTKGLAVTDLVVTDIPDAAKKLTLIHLFDGNINCAINTAKVFGIADSLNEIREQAASLNCGMGRESVGQSLHLREFEVTYSPAGPVVITKRRYIDELVAPLLRQFD
jgi:hypothetical protein